MSDSLFSGSKKAEEGAPLLISNSVPRDKYQVAFGIFVLQGLGILLPWNAFISATAYFTELYGASFVFFISLAFNWSGLLCFAILMKVLPRFSFMSRVMVALSVFFAVLITIPFLHDAPRKVSMTITLAGVFLSGFASAILQSSIAGLAALFPPEYMGGMMSGCGVAGIVAIVLLVVTKVAMPQTPEGNEEAVKLFFILAAGVIVLCAASFHFLMRLPITQYNLINYYKNRDIENTETKMEAASFFVIIKKVWKDALTVVMTFFVSLALFPGITALVKSNSDHVTADWFSIIFIAIFMVGDITGRTVPRWVRIYNVNLRLALSFLRCAFFPLLVFCIHPLLFTTDWISCSIVAVFALSNGYLSTLGMIFGPQKVAAHERELTGIIMAGTITAGIVIGSHFAFLMLYLVTGSIGVSL